MFSWFKSNTQKPDNSETEELRQQIYAYVDEVCGDGAGFHPERKIKQSEHGRALLDQSADQLIVLLYTTMQAYIDMHNASKSGSFRTYTSISYCESSALQQLMVQLMRRNLPYNEEDLLALMQLANDNNKSFSWYRPHNSLFGLLERNYPKQNLPNKLVKEVERSVELTRGFTYLDADGRKLIERGERLLGKASEASLKPDSEWSRSVITQLESFDPDIKRLWLDLIKHARTATMSKPSKKWQATAEVLIISIGEQEYVRVFKTWLAEIQAERPETLPLSDDVNATIVRGLVWAACSLPPELVASEIRSLGAYCYRKVKNIGAVSPKVANACLYVLGELPGVTSVALLTELLQKIKYPSARKLVEKALDEAAKRNNMTRDDLMEVSVPDFGLDSNGELRETFGEFTAWVKVESEQKVVLLWEKSDGKIQKGVPTAIKQSCSAEIGELKKKVKEIQMVLQAQKLRIEKLFLRPTAWRFYQWRDRYLGPPLLTSLTHKLIWLFEYDSQSIAAMMIDGHLCNAEGEDIESELDLVAERVQVRLWHPVYASVDQVMAWRRVIGQQGITQPFKQAHREVYLLTDAERTTSLYSNRFAAHILKQHQLSALCQQRGWQYSLQGMWDSANSPILELPQWKISVELYLDIVESSENGMGIFNYVSSDQVRFTRESETLVLDEVEPIVFSEVMRDVDLFIAVCSIGNDPEWGDRGDRMMSEYWHDYSFGDLLDSAKTRREVLMGLLPKLKIADRCEINGNFLIVRGEYRIYKIHLGSGNILMEPNDQYLCIVEGRGTTNTGKTNSLVLPFEGDHRMSVILSKAFLLADDMRIKDKTILSQIKHR
jgi:hypothetical protein